MDTSRNVDPSEPSASAADNGQQRENIPYPDWINNFNNRCLKTVGTKCPGKLEELMDLYIRNIKHELELCVKSPNRAALIAKMMYRTLIFFYLYYQNIKEYFVITTWSDLMVDLLSYYCQMEMKASQRWQRGRETDSMICSRIMNIMWICLSYDEECMLHVLLKNNKSYSKKHKDIFEPIFKKLLNTNTRSQVRSDFDYMRKLLTFKTWKKVCAKDDKKVISDLALARLQAPSDFHLNMSKYNFLPPCIDTRDINKYLITTLFDLDKSIEKYFTYLESKQLKSSESDIRNLERISFLPELYEALPSDDEDLYDSDSLCGSLLDQIKTETDNIGDDDDVIFIDEEPPPAMPRTNGRKPKKKTSTAGGVVYIDLTGDEAELITVSDSDLPDWCLDIIQNSKCTVNLSAASNNDVEMKQTTDIISTDHNANRENICKASDAGYREHENICDEMDCLNSPVDGSAGSIDESCLQSPEAMVECSAPDKPQDAEKSNDFAVVTSNSIGVGPDEEFDKIANSDPVDSENHISSSNHIEENHSEMIISSPQEVTQSTGAEPMDEANEVENYAERDVSHHDESGVSLTEISSTSQSQESFNYNESAAIVEDLPEEVPPERQFITDRTTETPKTPQVAVEIEVESEKSVAEYLDEAELVTKKDETSAQESLPSVLRKDLKSVTLPPEIVTQKGDKPEAISQKYESLVQEPSKSITQNGEMHVIKLSKPDTQKEEESVLEPMGSITQYEDTFIADPNETIVEEEVCLEGEAELFDDESEIYVTEAEIYEHVPQYIPDLKRLEHEGLSQKEELPPTNKKVTKGMPTVESIIQEAVESSSDDEYAADDVQEEVKDLQPNGYVPIVSGRYEGDINGDLQTLQDVPDNLTVTEYIIEDVAENFDPKGSVVCANIVSEPFSADSRNGENGAVSNVAFEQFVTEQTVSKHSIDDILADGDVNKGSENIPESSLRICDNVEENVDTSLAINDRIVSVNVEPVNFCALPHDKDTENSQASDEASPSIEPFLDQDFASYFSTLGSHVEPGESARDSPINFMRDLIVNRKRKNGDSVIRTYTHTHKVKPKVSTSDVAYSDSEGSVTSMDPVEQPVPVNGVKSVRFYVENDYFTKTLKLNNREIRLLHPEVHIVRKELDQNGMVKSVEKKRTAKPELLPMNSNTLLPGIHCAKQSLYLDKAKAAKGTILERYDYSQEKNKVKVDRRLHANNGGTYCAAPGNYSSATSVSRQTKRRGAREAPSPKVVKKRKRGKEKTARNKKSSTQSLPDPTPAVRPTRVYPWRYNSTCQEVS